jgi:integrase
MNSLAFGKLFDLYLAKISRKSKKHRDSMRQTRDRFPDLLSMLASDITAAKLDELLLPLPPASRDLVIKHWRSVMRYGIKRGYLTVNVADRLDLHGTEIKEVQIYSIEDVHKLLTDALEHELNLLPFYCLCGFAGVRPQDEIETLEWQYVHWRERKPFVAIPAVIAKTGKFREVELSKNAAAWLRAYVDRGGFIEGRVMQWSRDMIRRHRKASMKRVGVALIQDGLRHSYASYWQATYRDTGKLMSMMGHTNPRTFSRHYHSGVPRSEAEKFWAILPPKQAGKRKIVPFTKAA